MKKKILWEIKSIIPEANCIVLRIKRAHVSVYLDGISRK